MHLGLIAVASCIIGSGALLAGTSLLLTSIRVRPWWVALTPVVMTRTEPRP